ncbi:MAG: SDR family NAD(P)-dependent oxidoreductase [Actinomycetota bacterium]
MPNNASNRPIALVTGATAGIGAAFAELLAAKSHDLVIVARDLPRLNARAEEWRSRHGIDVEVIQADLSRDEDIRRLELRLQNISRPVEVLINNAGFGINKSFTTSDVAEEIALLDVLVTAPMRLMHAVLPAMKSRNSGTIINVSSVAGWIAGGTYSAAKSYVTVLSESLHTELRETNIKVHALCPGFTRTEFHQRGKMKMGALPDSMWLTAEQVVSDAWKAATKGKAISVPGGQYKLLSFISRFAPRPLVRKVGMNVRVRQRQK